MPDRNSPSLRPTRTERRHDNNHDHILLITIHYDNMIINYYHG